MGLAQVRRRVALALGACGLLGAACVVGPKYEAPARQAPASYKEARGEQADGGAHWAEAHPSDASQRGAWWAVYGIPELDGLERQLDINNQTLKQFFENYMAARALVGQARSHYFPTVSVGLGANYNSRGGALAGGLAGAPAESGLLFSAPVDIAWAPDLWGKVRSAVRQAQDSAQASAALLEGQRLTEQVSLAQFYFELRGQDALQQVLDETVASYEKSLDLTRSQYETGIGDELAVVEAQNTLEAAQASAANLAIARAQFEHAIATLVGKPASEFGLAANAQVPEAPHVPPGLPSELLERRPDVAAAERTMAAANAQIGIAEAAYYPSLTLSLSAGLQSSSLSRLFALPSRFWSVGPSLSETVFDAGLRAATVRQYVAAYNADLAAYRQTVLAAFQQVEDGLATEHALAKEVEFQRRAVESAQRRLQLEQSRYETGIDPYVNVVLAQNAVLSARQALVLVQTQQLTASVQLIGALGGGWNRERLPSPEQVSERPTEEDSRQQK